LAHHYVPGVIKIWLGLDKTLINDSGLGARFLLSGLATPGIQVNVGIVHVLALPPRGFRGVLIETFDIHTSRIGWFRLVAIFLLQGTLYLLSYLRAVVVVGRWQPE
jgi:hypothetical protein